MHVEGETTFVSAGFLRHFELDVFPEHCNFLFLQRGLVDLGWLSGSVIVWQHCRGTLKYVISRW